jgi:hypothetical protein
MKGGLTCIRHVFLECVSRTVSGKRVHIWKGKKGSCGMVVRQTTGLKWVALHVTGTCRTKGGTESLKNLVFTCQTLF